ncbi:DUF421 domain-containing protein [Frateuria sp. STR12]|uniref:DUF421 domain-containing protein n=1 Tax=Frateuria hangzhouensis TaxID=2995589 RepID=UPI002260AB65|nr:YetF domain-containing protein [Frateuria sp. STR12]MCX7513186.1 DUF421 domain-containing protein [Frateuria sp. STR12]
MDISSPWWVYALRVAGVYLGLLVLLRLLGKRSFGEMTTFDIVVLMLVGGTLRTAIIGDDKTPLAAIIGVLAIFLLDKGIAWACARWPRLDRLVEGHASLLVRDGRVIDGALRKHDMSEEAFRRVLREKGLREVGDVAEVRLEANGKISVLRASKPD